MWEKAVSAPRRQAGIGVIAGFLWLFCAGMAGQAGAETLIRESFGLNGGTRFDAAGNPVTVFLAADLNGLRAEFPNTSAEVWDAPGGHHAQTWQFSVSSHDPYEPFSPYEPLASQDIDNGSVTVSLDTGAPLGVDALLPLSPPAGAYRVSVDRPQ